MINFWPTLWNLGFNISRHKNNIMFLLSYRNGK
uniref:Uncharacterized protein n=1 Tax=Rhizophora mucronata TaxID=61149 RepID=A0A2P2QAM3_RHIMU